MVCSCKLPHAGRIKRKEEKRKRNRKTTNKFLYMYTEEDGEKSPGKSHAKPLHVVHFLFSPRSIAVDGERVVYIRSSTHAGMTIPSRPTAKGGRPYSALEEEDRREWIAGTYKKTVGDIKTLIEVDLPLSCLDISPAVISNLFSIQAFPSIQPYRLLFIQFVLFLFGFIRPREIHSSGNIKEWHKCYLDGNGSFLFLHSLLSSSLHYWKTQSSRRVTAPGGSGRDEWAHSYGGH